MRIFFMNGLLIVFGSLVYPGHYLVHLAVGQFGLQVRHRYIPGCMGYTASQVTIISPGDQVTIPFQENTAATRRVPVPMTFITVGLQDLYYVGSIFDTAGVTRWSRNLF